MIRTSLLAVTAVAWAALASTGVAPASTPGAAEETGETEIPVAQAAADQGAAIRLAREVDLPALEKADRVVIEDVRQPGGRQVTLDKPGAIKELRQALEAARVPPTGSETAALLSFYRGKTLIRKVWVFESGEWGFERSKGPHWTTGLDPALFRFVERHLK